MQTKDGEAARIATSDDVDDILSIRRDHLNSIDGQRGASLLVGFELSTSADPVTALFADESSFVVVGTYDGVTFGYCLVTVVRMDNGSRLGRLTEFVVEADIRKSGIGEAMMNLVIEELKVRDCIGVDSLALPGDRHTKNFFESFGLKARLLTVHRSFT